MSNATVLQADPGTSIIQIERIFDAPIEKVFRAFTTPERVLKWWSPFGRTRIDEYNPSVGGAWRIADVMENGDEIVFFGLFHEVTFPKRIVQTSEFANLPERGHVVLDRYEFFSLTNHRTRLVLTEAFLSIEDRDSAVDSGMEPGIIQQYINLDGLLASQEEK